MRWTDWGPAEVGSTPCTLFSWTELYAYQQLVVFIPKSSMSVEFITIISKLNILHMDEMSYYSYENEVEHFRGTKQWSH